MSKRIKKSRKIHLGRSELDRGSCNSEDYDTARVYWKKRLSGEKLINTKQDNNCQFAIVVPVYNERVDRISKQIKSIKNQTRLSSDEFEIIYIVNNGIADNPKAIKIQKNNISVINYIRSLKEKNIHVIDKSSCGNEIASCNVGRARNRGVAEASYRFWQRGVNGWIVQIDADSYIEDKNYFKKLKSIISRDRYIIGVACGCLFEFNPDTQDRRKRKTLRQKTKLLLLQKCWIRLIQFIQNPDNPLFKREKRFHGVNMISRSYESAAIGGLIDKNSREDAVFGLSLEEYACCHNRKVIGAKNKLIVTSSIRESDRTLVSYGYDYAKIDLKKPLVVDSPFSIKPEKIPLTEKNYKKLSNLVCQVPGGNEVVRYYKKQLNTVRYLE